jgi:hypothetical protein
MKIVKLISFLVVGVVVFCFLKASADIDVILKPGEAKSIQVEKEEVVNMACVQGTPPDNDEFKFVKMGDQRSCDYNMSRIQRFMEETPSSKPVSLSAICDGDQKLVVKVWGVPVGGRGNFIYKTTLGCPYLNLMVYLIDDLSSDQGTFKAYGYCDDDKKEYYIKLTAIRFK